MEPVDVHLTGVNR